MVQSVDEYLELCAMYQQSPEVDLNGSLILGVHREALMALDKQHRVDVKIQRREPIGFTIKTNGNFVLSNSFEDRHRAETVMDRLNKNFPLDTREIVPLYVE